MFTRNRQLMTCLLCILAAATLPCAAQDPALRYQNRGRYREGILPSPSNAPRFDLISALIDYPSRKMGVTIQFESHRVPIYSSVV